MAATMTACRHEHRPHSSPVRRCLSSSFPRTHPSTARLVSFDRQYEDPSLELEDLVIHASTSLQHSLGFDALDDQDQDEGQDFERIYASVQLDSPRQSQNEPSEQWENHDSQVCQWQERIYLRAQQMQQLRQATDFKNYIHRTNNGYHQSYRPLTRHMSDNSEQLVSSDCTGLNPCSTRRSNGAANHCTVAASLHITPSDKTKPATNNRETIFRPRHDDNIAIHKKVLLNKDKDESVALSSSNIRTDRRHTGQENSIRPSHSMFTHSTRTTASSPESISRSLTPSRGILRNHSRSTTLSPAQYSSSHTIITREDSTTPSSTRRQRSGSRDRRRRRSRNTRHRAKYRSSSCNPVRGESFERRSQHDRDSTQNDDYHASLFRGAAMIREQLLRSMASADMAMDMADREFMEGMIECRNGARRSGSFPTVIGHEDDHPTRPMMNLQADDDFLGFDYSKSNHLFDTGRPSRLLSGEAGTAAACLSDPDVNVANGYVTTPTSTTSSLELLESESRRLDNLIKMFSQNSSSSSLPSSSVTEETNSSPVNMVNNPDYSYSSKAAEEKNISSSRNESNEYPQDEVKVTEEALIAHSDISRSPSSIPTALNSPTSQVVASSTHRKGSDGNEKHCFQDTSSSTNGMPNLPTTSLLTITANEVANMHKEQVTNQEDEALSHARRAGPLWRSLVGNHVRFPTHWDSILPATSPPVFQAHSKWSKWYYVARHRVNGDKRLNSRQYGVHSRRSGGRILMRLLVRETSSGNVCRELAIGCFHPNAKGIRKADPIPEIEDARDIWIAVRWVIPSDDNESLLYLSLGDDDVKSFIDSFLTQRQMRLDYETMGSALGRKRDVKNENVRAIFGDQPPLKTVDLHEDELANKLRDNGEKKLAVLPALLLLKLFLFSK